MKINIIALFFLMAASACQIGDSTQEKSTETPAYTFEENGLELPVDSTTNNFSSFLYCNEKTQTLEFLNTIRNEIITFNLETKSISDKRHIDVEKYGKIRGFTHQNNDLILYNKSNTLFNVKEDDSTQISQFNLTETLSGIIIFPSSARGITPLSSKMIFCGFSLGAKDYPCVVSVDLYDSIPKAQPLLYSSKEYNSQVWTGTELEATYYAYHKKTNTILASFPVDHAIHTYSFDLQQSKVVSLPSTYLKEGFTSFLKSIESVFEMDPSELELKQNMISSYRQVYVDNEKDILYRCLYLKPEIESSDPFQRDLVIQCIDINTMSVLAEVNLGKGLNSSSAFVWKGALYLGNMNKIKENEEVMVFSKFSL